MILLWIEKRKKKTTLRTFGAPRLPFELVFTSFDSILQDQFYFLKQILYFLTGKYFYFYNISTYNLCLFW